MKTEEIIDAIGGIDEEMIRSALKKEKRYGVAYKIRTVLYALILLVALLCGANAFYKGPISEPPMDARFSAVSKEYSNFPVFSKSKWFRLAVGMSTDDFLHEYGLDVLVASDPEKYPYDKDFCIDLPEEEIRVASKNGTIVYVSVYNYRLEGNGWEMYSPEGPAMFTMGFEGGGIFRHIMIDDVKAKLESKYGTPEYLTVDKSALRKREPENWAVYQIKADGYKDGYMVFKYRDNGRVPEIGTGIISAEEIAALPQYTQMLTREFISPGLWYIPFDW